MSSLRESRRGINVSRKLVERVSRVVDRHASRRGFLRNSAMTATAIAVAPVAYAIRPTTAEAAIISCGGLRCNAGSLCCDGYTDFCCLLTGENLCPPGTVVAGWWKADGSGYCDIDGPRPRYYLDCDPGCGCGGSGICSSGCTSAHCRCPDGCGTRKVECTRFRYGQCNQDVAWVGPIQCRIVTCVPPWQWDPKCTTSVATDNHTRWHDRPCLHEGFTDVSPQSYYTEAVEWMVAEGITTGLNNDLFGPGEPTQRDHFATFLWRYEGEPKGSSNPGFSDVPRDSYFYEPVAWMAEADITTGTSSTQFSPNKYVSRAESVTFLHRLAGKPTPGAWLPFDDVPEDSWFGEAVAWAAQYGITTGVSPRRFGPTLAVTRGEAATFLHRFHLSDRGTVLNV